MSILISILLMITMLFILNLINTGGPFFNVMVGVILPGIFWGVLRYGIIVQQITGTYEVIIFTYGVSFIVYCLIVFGGQNEHTTKKGKIDKRYKDNPYLYIFSSDYRNRASASLVSSFIAFIILLAIAYFFPSILGNY
ncbi:MAG: hypothetical protein AB1598_12025 [Thermodesulfobacteriota bacterium]